MEQLLRCDPVFITSMHQILDQGIEYLTYSSLDSTVTQMLNWGLFALPALPLQL